MNRTKLNGKTIIFLGSSVTYGAASGGVSFADFVCERNGATMIKEAVSGTTLVDEDSSSYISRMKTITCDKADLFICQLSTNDATKKKPLGEINGEGKEYDLHTITGAIEYIILYAKEKWNCPIVFYTNPKYDSNEYLEMVKRLKEIAAEWQIDIINLWDEATINEISPELYKKYMQDPIHPTKEGYLELWTPYIEAKIAEII